MTQQIKTLVEMELVKQHPYLFLVKELVKKSKTFSDYHKSYCRIKAKISLKITWIENQKAEEACKILIERMKKCAETSKQKMAILDLEKKPEEEMFFDRNEMTYNISE